MTAPGAARRELTVTREAVCAAVAGGCPWEQAAESLGLRPGLAFLIATGIPADGSGVPELADRTCGGQALSSPQSLVNPRGHNPLTNELVASWLRGRAARELG